MVNDQKVVRSVDFAHRESFSLNPVVSTGSADGNAVEHSVPSILTSSRWARRSTRSTAWSVTAARARATASSASDGRTRCRTSSTTRGGRAVGPDGAPNPLAYDGHIFDIIMNGKPAPTSPSGYAMPPYGGRVTVEEAWAIVAYLRTIQATQARLDRDAPRVRPFRGRSTPPQRGATSTENPNGVNSEHRSAL